MYINDFTYHKPKTLDEACGILLDSDDGAVLAGGTDLLVEMKQGKRDHRDVVSLADIQELKSISVNGNSLSIGAVVTLNEIINSNILEKNCSAVAEAARTIAAEQIRNTATIGGNLCTAASCCDMAPILIALGARVELVSLNSKRSIPLKDFFTGHRMTVLTKGELLKKIVITIPAAGAGVCYKKFGLRNAASIAVASVAVIVRLHSDICTDACVVLGAAAPTPKISKNSIDLIVDKNLSGNSCDSSFLKQVGKAAAEDAEPISDLRGSAEFRRRIINILCQQALVEAIYRARVV